MPGAGLSGVSSRNSTAATRRPRSRSLFRLAKRFILYLIILNIVLTGILPIMPKSSFKLFQFRDPFLDFGFHASSVFKEFDEMDRLFGSLFQPGNRKQGTGIY